MINFPKNPDNEKSKIPTLNKSEAYKLFKQFMYEINKGLEQDYVQTGEVRLIPKTSSNSTAEGTMFYDSDDDHVYVATE